MSGSVNKVIIVGNLGADPEVKSFQNGGKICNLRIATSESWKDRASGERKERTEWHSVVIGGDGLVGIAERFLRKGSKVYIEGKLQTRKWQDQSGNDRYSTEVSVNGPGAVITMLDSAQSGGMSNDRPGGYGASGGGYGQRNDGPRHDNQSGFGGGNAPRGGGSMQGAFGGELDDELPPFVTMGGIW